MTQSRVAGQEIFAPLDFGKLLGAGLMLGAIAFLLQTHNSGIAALHTAAPVRITMIDASQSPPAFDPEAGMSAGELMGRWEPTIAAAAKRFNIPAAWIRNVMRNESGGHTLLNGRPIVSDRGALGLMQVEPGTYSEMAAQYRLGGDPFDPHDNIYAGAAYLRWLHGKYGFPAMFAAYNAGPGHLEDHLYHGQPLPQETRAYVASITRALGQGAEWLTRGDKLTVTAPNGVRIALDRSQIRSVRAALPGEYAPGVATVIDLGKMRQGVQESPETILAAIGPGRHHSA